VLWEGKRKREGVNGGIRRRRPFGCFGYAVLCFTSGLIWVLPFLSFPFLFRSGTVCDCV
jgi:hypothetical protein